MKTRTKADVLKDLEKAEQNLKFLGSYDGEGSGDEDAGDDAEDCVKRLKAELAEIVKYEQREKELYNKIEKEIIAKFVAANPHLHFNQPNNQGTQPADNKNQTSSAQSNTQTASTSATPAIK